tara:strand:- start:2308 stop:2727 length:420 start_codon:yes stop_codon:yes gene_type:complete
MGYIIIKNDDDRDGVDWMFKAGFAIHVLEQIEDFYPEVPSDTVWQEFRNSLYPGITPHNYWDLSMHAPEHVTRFVAAAVQGAQALARGGDQVVIEESRIEETKFLFNDLFRCLEIWHLIPDDLREQIPRFDVSLEREPF